VRNAYIPGSSWFPVELKRSRGFSPFAADPRLNLKSEGTEPEFPTESTENTERREAVKEREEGRIRAPTGVVALRIQPAFVGRRI
jgi:hypothetical protein